MKTGFWNKILLASLVVIVAVTITGRVSGQTTMGILPVNTSAVNSAVLNVQQWQGISSKMHDYLVAQLAGAGTVSKLSREHILLLLKEIPAPDPENLDAEAYKIISKKEKLHYLLKSSVESIQVTGKNVLAPLRVIIVDGNTGMVFWEDVIKTNRVVSNPAVTEHILLEEVFKPSINELSREIITLKY